MSASGADLLVTGGDVVTMNGAREVLVGGAVAVLDGRIVAVGSTSALRATYPGTAELDAAGCVVTPGMVDAHQHHTGDALVRSAIPDDLPLGESIYEWAVPLHAAHTADDDEIASLLTCVESLRSGVTTVVEAGTVAHPDRVADAMTRAGLRGSVGRWGSDTPGLPLSAPADEVLAEAKELLERYPPGGRVTAWVTLVGHSLASDDLLAGAAALARRFEAPMTMHISPSDTDVHDYLSRTGVRPLVHLDRLGVLGPHLVLAHAVHLDDDEVDLLLASRSAVAYCPWAYLRLGQGVAHAGRHAEIVERGGRVALGCDSVNAGDAIDVLRTAALASGLAKDQASDATRLPAAVAFELATIRGADAIGMAGTIGSLEVGKAADLVVHRTDGPGWVPRGDLAHTLVWSTDGRSVRDVVVDGRVVVRDGVCTTVDEVALREAATTARADLLRRAGMSPPSSWPLIPSE
ncbi:MAG: amidohydrolase family protein [Candidatus Nanopelagicales bacterium]|nr:amidohydrolase family protein [Candidatus Nanopelagicales bacterium]